MSTVCQEENRFCGDWRSRYLTAVTVITIFTAGAVQAPNLLVEDGGDVLPTSAQ